MRLPSIEVLLKVSYMPGRFPSCLEKPMGIFSLSSKNPESVLFVEKSIPFMVVPPRVFSMEDHLRAL